MSGGSVSFEERRSAHYGHLYPRCVQALELELTPGRFRALLFHEAVHYCRMLTYRAAIDAGSVAMSYAIATRLFNEFMAQYESADQSAALVPLAAAAR